MILGFMNANAQSPEKIEQLKDTVSTFANAKLLQDLKDATGMEWSKESVNQLFDYSPEKKSEIRDIPKLELGSYGGNLKVAKVTSQNHMKDGRIRFIVDILDKRYVNSNIFKNIKNYNKELKDILITFTIKGTPLPTKDIKL